MKVIAGIVGASVSLASGCDVNRPVQEPRQMYRNCSIERTNAYGTFRGQGHELSWSSRLPDDIYVEFKFFVWLDPKDGERLRTFGGLSDVRDFYLGWFSPRWKKLEQRHGEARIGSTVIVHDYHFQPYEYFASDDSRKLMATNGDLMLSLYDRNGVELQRINVPRSFLLGVEQELKKVSGEVREKMLDKEHRCPLEPVPIVIVT